MLSEKLINKNIVKENDICLLHKLTVREEYKFYVAVFSGLVLIFLYMSHEMPAFFVELFWLREEGQNNQILRQIYFVSNLFLPLYSGYIADYIGYRFVLMALHIPLFLGSLFLVFSCNNQHLNVEGIIVGSMLFSLGGDSIKNVVMTIVAKYFYVPNYQTYGIVVSLFIYNLGQAIFKFYIYFEAYELVMFNPKVYLDSSFWGFGSVILCCLICLIFTYFENWRNRCLVHAPSPNFWKFILMKENAKCLHCDYTNLYPYSFCKSFTNIFNVHTIWISISYGIMWGSYTNMVTFNRNLFFSQEIPEKINYESSEAYFSLIIDCLMGVTGLFILSNRYDRYRDQRYTFVIIGCFLTVCGYMIFDVIYESFQEGKDVDYSLLNFIFCMGALFLGIGMGLFSFSIFSLIPTFCYEENLTICYGFVSSIGNLVQFIMVTWMMETVEYLNSKNNFWIPALFCLIIYVVLNIMKTESKLYKK